MKTNKHIKHYITLHEGQDYRTIAKIMSKAGFRMNHATARNVLMSAMNNFLDNLSKEIGVQLTQEKIEELLKDQEIHNVFIDILFKACGEIKNELEISNNLEQQNI